MIEDRHTVSKELFQINYLEPLEAMQARFDPLARQVPSPSTRFVASG